MLGIAIATPQIKIKVRREERYHQAQDHGDPGAELGVEAGLNAKK